MGKSEEGRKQQDAKTTPHESQSTDCLQILPSNTGIPLKEAKKSTVINYFVFKLSCIF